MINVTKKMVKIMQYKYFAQVRFEMVAAVVVAAVVGVVVVAVVAVAVVEGQVGVAGIRIITNVSYIVVVGSLSI